MQPSEQGYLPASVRVGQKIIHRPEGCDRMDLGRVVQIPSHRRFAVVEYSVTFMGIYGVPVSYSFRETLRIMPPPDALATSVAPYKPDLGKLPPLKDPEVLNRQRRARGQVPLDGPRIRRLMAALGLSAPELSRRMGVGSSTAGWWVNTCGWCPSDKAADMASVLGCKPQDIILPQ